MSAWEEAVAGVLSRLQPGEVVTYGEVAEQAGRAGAARAVGRYLAASDGAHPWWRVVTSTGRLVPGLEAEQARLLRAEGVEVAGGRVAAARTAQTHDGRSLLRIPGDGERRTAGG
jgi:methylated-DNA-protein-cysteine methyltransferase related protein